MNSAKHASHDHVIPLCPMFADWSLGGTNFCLDTCDLISLGILETLAVRAWQVTLVTDLQALGREYA